MTASTMPARTAKQTYHRFLFKTMLRSAVWVVAALAMTYFYPEATWVWYVVATFMLISLAVGFIFAWMASRKALENQRSKLPGQ